MGVYSMDFSRASFTGPWCSCFGLNIPGLLHLPVCKWEAITIRNFFDHHLAHLSKSHLTHQKKALFATCITSPKINMSPQKGLFQQEIRLPTIDFQALCSFSGEYLFVYI